MEWNEFKNGAQDGAYIKCTINNGKVEGVITVKFGIIYICQNIFDGGWDTIDKKGYLYGWRVEDTNFYEIKEIEFSRFIRGEKVLVRNELDITKAERIYLTTVEGAEYPYVCVNGIGDSEKNFIEGKPFDMINWKYVYKISSNDDSITNAVKILTDAGKIKDGKILI